MPTIIFKLNISSGNAALVDSPQEEVARILRKAADQLDAGYSENTCKDINGNTVGSWSHTINTDNDDISYCPDCGVEISVVMGTFPGKSYVEYYECSECGYTSI